MTEGVTGLLQYTNIVFGRLFRCVFCPTRLKTQLTSVYVQEKNKTILPKVKNKTKQKQNGLVICSHDLKYRLLLLGGAKTTSLTFTLND